MVDSQGAHLGRQYLRPAPAPAHRDPPCSAEEWLGEMDTAGVERVVWFWIHQSDLASKRSFSFLMAVFNFADTGKPENLPLVVQ